MARKTKQQALETRQHILDVALRLFSQQGVSATSLAEIANAAGVTRGAIYWHFKNKSDLFSEIWELSESNIGELEIEYQAKFPDDPLSVLREILVHILEATVTEERRRLLMEIIFHKCEFVGEMVVVQQAQRSLCLESYDRIEQTLKHCINAKMLPENLLTRRAAILMRSFISGLMENWLFAPQSFDLKRSSRLRHDPAGDVSIVSDAARVDGQRLPDNIPGKLLDIFCVAILFVTGVIFLRLNYFRSACRFRHFILMTMLQLYKRSQHFVFITISVLIILLSCQSLAFARGQTNGDLPSKADVQNQLDTLNKQKISPPRISSSSRTLLIR